MKAIVLLVLGFVLINNYALSAALGLVPLLGFSARRQKTLVLALAVTVVTIVTAAALWLLRGAIPAHFQILAAVLIMLVLV